MVIVEAQREDPHPTLIRGAGGPGEGKKGGVGCHGQAYPLARAGLGGCQGLRRIKATDARTSEYACPWHPQTDPAAIGSAATGFAATDASAKDASAAVKTLPNEDRSKNRRRTRRRWQSAVANWRLPSRRGRRLRRPGSIRVRKSRRPRGSRDPAGYNDTPPPRLGQVGRRQLQWQPAKRRYAPAPTRPALPALPDPARPRGNSAGPRRPRRTGGAGGPRGTRHPRPRRRQALGRRPSRPPRRGFHTGRPAGRETGLARLLAEPR